MLFLSKKIIVTPITGHIPINQINNKINKSLLRNKINSLLQTLKYVVIIAKVAVLPDCAGREADSDGPQRL